MREGGVKSPNGQSSATAGKKKSAFSLKDVLPALVPEMTYEGMAVANGQDAGLAWESLVWGCLDRAERDKIRKALLDYCGQDTLAMVRLVEKLRISH